MKKIFLALLGLATLQIANAQLSLTTLTYSQNFNSLDTAITPSASFPPGWSTYEVGTSGAVDQMYAGGDGSFNGGNTYSYGTAATTERALGSIASGSNKMKYGVGFTNNTGSIITSLQIFISLSSITSCSFLS